MGDYRTMSDAIDDAHDTGHDGTFTYNGTLYTFNENGLLTFIIQNMGPLLPTADPHVVGQA